MQRQRKKKTLIDVLKSSEVTNTQSLMFDVNCVTSIHSNKEHDGFMCDDSEVTIELNERKNKYKNRTHKQNNKKNNKTKVK